MELRVKLRDTLTGEEEKLKPGSITNNLCIWHTKKGGTKILPKYPWKACLFTGFKDAKGKEIFEHDVLIFPDGCAVEIKFIEKEGCWGTYYLTSSLHSNCVDSGTMRESHLVCNNFIPAEKRDAKIKRKINFLFKE